MGVVDLRSVIEATLETLQPAADAKGITVQTVWSEGATLIGDQDRLRQVMWNLLSNAIKFTPKGGVVRVELGATAQEVGIAVADNGRGIEADFLPHVFDRFTQADSSFARLHNGLGLGMAIVRHLVELHGGRVSVESPGKDLGTTFRVTLPIRVAVVDAVVQRNEQQAASYDARADALPSLDGVSVLIVDDEAEAREDSGRVGRCCVQHAEDAHPRRVDQRCRDARTGRSCVHAGAQGSRRRPGCAGAGGGPDRLCDAGRRRQRPRRRFRSARGEAHRALGDY